MCKYLKNAYASIKLYGFYLFEVKTKTGSFSWLEIDSLDHDGTNHDNHYNQFLL